MSNVFIRNGTYPLLLIDTVYNTHTHKCTNIYIYIYIRGAFSNFLDVFIQAFKIVVYP